MVDDLVEILRATRPDVVYTHNLADKHDTHVAVALRTIAAIRRLPAAERPSRLYGCEVWRDLDWMPDEEKVAFDLSAHESLQAALIGVFDSQICGGKRYDLATQGRRRAHATYAASHGTDAATSLSYAMDLTPLVADPSLSPADVRPRGSSIGSAPTSRRASARSRGEPMTLEREIHEQPAVLARLLDSAGRGHPRHRRTACARGGSRPSSSPHAGSSDNAGLYAKYVWGVHNGLPIALAAPSLFSVYKRPPVDRRLARRRDLAVGPVARHRRRPRGRAAAGRRTRWRS